MYLLGLKVALEKHSVNVGIILIILFMICFPQWNEGRDLSVSVSTEPAVCSSVPGTEQMFVDVHTRRMNE